LELEVHKQDFRTGCMDITQKLTNTEVQIVQLYSLRKIVTKSFDHIYQNKCLVIKMHKILVIVYLHVHFMLFCVLLYALSKLQ